MYVLKQYESITSECAHIISLCNELLPEETAEKLAPILGMEKEEILSMRALDLIELNLGIKVDEYVTALQVGSTYKMQHNMKDSFSTEYKYQ